MYPSCNYASEENLRETKSENHSKWEMVYPDMFKRNFMAQMFQKNTTLSKHVGDDKETVSENKHFCTH